MKVVVAAFNQEKALVGAFSVIVQLQRLIDLRHYLCGGVAEAGGEAGRVQLCSGAGLGGGPPGGGGWGRHTRNLLLLLQLLHHLIHNLPS